MPVRISPETNAGLPATPELITAEVPVRRLIGRPRRSWVGPFVILAVAEATHGS